jgi:hypothetical protein
MLGCVGMCIIGPVLALAGVGFPSLERLGQRLARIGPLMEVHTLSHGGGSPPAGGQWAWVGLVGLAAVACWIGLGLASAARRRE